jgi:ABC-type Na+ efflux pump permease subunit
MIVEQPLGTISPSPSYKLGEGTLAGKISAILSNVIGIITLVAGLAFLFYFIIGATGLLSAGGDPQKAQKAQQQMLNAIIGLIITIAAYPILSLISQLLGIPLTEPGQLINQFLP